MSQPDTAELSGDSDWLRGDAAIEAFESAWQSGETPHIEDFLLPADDPARRHVLEELVKLDLDYRWRQGERPRAEDYAQRFRELGEPHELPIELIAFEFRVRRSHGMEPSNSEMLRRFPSRAVELREFEAAELDGADSRVRTGFQSGHDPHATPIAASTPEIGHSRESLGNFPTAADQRIGRYELRGAVGRGGFATVYRAWDPELRRDVAIKVPRADFAGEHAHVQRVLREARSAAQLRHPAIVPIHEVGEHAECTYIVYEFIPGPTLADVLRDSRPTERQAAEWTARIAEALEYAHECGVVHRDVKPANILMDRDGQPMLADFGLALDRDSGATVTQQGDVLGTPAYMSPEQARGDNRDVDARTDVYSLGVTLYQLLCGQTPFQGSPTSILHKVIHDEPQSPRNLRPSVSLDLETICLKAMAKEPARRYATAGAMGADLRRYLNHEPILARPVSVVGRLALWCRRKPALAATIAAASVVTITVAMLSFWRVARERDRAQELSANLAFDTAIGLCERGDAGRGMLWLARTLELTPDRAEHLPWVIRMNLDAWRHEVGRLRLVLGPAEPVTEIGSSPDGRTVFTYFLENRLLALWDVETAVPIALPTYDSMSLMAISRDGRRLLIGQSDQTLTLWERTTTPTQTRRVSEGEQPVPIGSPLRTQTRVSDKDHPTAGTTSFALRATIADRGLSNRRHLTFAADGNSFLTLGDELAVWDAATGRRVSGPIPSECNIAALSPDGRVALTATSENVVRLWDVSSGEAISPPVQQDSDVSLALFSAGGTTALTVCRSGIVQLWDVRAGRPVDPPVRHPGGCQAAALSPDGELLLTGGSDMTARLWSTSTVEPIGPTLRHAAAVKAADFSPDGRIIVTGSDDRTARLWRTDIGTPLGAPFMHADRVTAVSFAADGNSIATGAMDGFTRVWSVPPSRQIGPTLEQSTAIWDAAISRDGSLLVTASGAGSNQPAVVQLWDAKTGSPRGPPLPHWDMVKSVAISPDGSSILTGCWDGAIQLWNATSGKPTGEAIRQEGYIAQVAFSRDGSRFLTGNGLQHYAQLWDANSRQPLARLPHDESVRDADFSRDGRLIATVSYDQTVRLWDATTFIPVSVPLRHQGQVGAVAFSPDSKFVISGTDDNTAQVWNVATQQPIGAPLQHQGTVRSVAFSPDGKLVLTGSLDKTVRLWEPMTGKLVGAPIRHSDGIEAAAFTPDGRSIVTAGWDGTARFWPVPAPVSGTIEQIRLWCEVITGIELDSSGAIRPLDPATWQQRAHRLNGFGSPVR